MSPTFRKATAADLPAVVRIFDDIITCEEQGGITVGWIRGVYPTESTAQEALAAGELYVLESDGQIAASGRINQVQMPAYSRICWQESAAPEKVWVLHTLTVAPAASGKGLGRTFVGCYEELARQRGGTVARLDTNARNAAARHLYVTLGYRESGITPCNFCGIPDVDLVCMEKKLT